MKRKHVARLTKATFCTALLALPVAALSQDAPHSTVASPEVYRVIAENARYRVVAATWQPGQRDAWHSHPESAVYILTFCHLRLHSPDGTSREVSPPVDAAFLQPPFRSHSAENVGKTACRMVMFEPK